jgi:daunorubicin resistance ABC transporter ATP-binding subunit
VAAAPIIEVAEVAKSFGTTIALDRLSLQVAEGRVAALLGPNGAGKTTLVRILATLLRPDGGRVLLAGVDAVAQPVAIRRMIGLAGQHAAIDDTLTGRENLVMIGRLYRLSARQARQAASHVLEQLSLTDAADRPVRTYSGGMRRRRDVGASLVGRPKVLLLDEPSTGLDPTARQELWALLAQLVSEGSTILLTTQQLEEANHLADTVTIIDHGAVVSQGTPFALNERLGYETIEVTLAEANKILDAVELLRPISLEQPTVNKTAAQVSFRASRHTSALPTTVRLLDHADIAVEDVTARRPSLDDVFISLVRRPTQTEPTKEKTPA